MVFSTRALARRRRWNHQGMPRITVAIPAICGSGLVSGPAPIAAASHPPVTAMTVAA
jgi:hypothetical protein